MFANQNAAFSVLLKSQIESPTSVEQDFTFTTILKEKLVTLPDFCLNITAIVTC